MAIPTWFTNPDLVGSPTASDADLDDASETFERLSDPVRLEILTTLHRHSDPVRYADLRASLSIRDNGCYALSDRGERLLRQVGVSDLREPE